MWLQHGFARTGERVADLAGRLADDGLLVVAPTLPTTDAACGLLSRAGYLDRFPALLAGRPGSGLLRSARRAAARAGVARPERLPERVVLAGHSAGAPAMTYVAERLLSGPASVIVDLRGVLLLDPVEDFPATLRRRLPAVLAAGVPVRAISSPPSACNAGASGTAVLAGVAAGFAGVTLTTGTHVDAEGASTGPLAELVCGRPSPENVGVLQTLAGAWTRGWIAGAPEPATEPGGDALEALIAAGVVRAVTGSG